jgi:hypothetical protein
MLAALRDYGARTEESPAMTVQNPIVAQESTAFQLDQISQLYAVLSIIEQMIPPESDLIEIPDESVLCHAFTKTSGIAKNGFQAVADETVIAATAGARALLDKGPEATIATEELVRYLRLRISQLGRFVGL